MKSGKIVIVQGGQWGSESKGFVVAELSRRWGAAAAVRTGSINAGHTVIYEGKPVVTQILPTAWSVPGVRLILGAGCYIESTILAEECARVSALLGKDIRTRLLIDHRCACFGSEELQRAQDANRHHVMGATGKGASEAIITKMRNRGMSLLQARQQTQFVNHPTAGAYHFVATDREIESLYRRGEIVVLEGTQGALLDFHLGPWPFVTTRSTNAAAWMAEAGIPPAWQNETILVVRSHPIRVAGNSGPMFNETSWPILTRGINQRLERVGRPPRVQESSILDYEDALSYVLNREFPATVAQLGTRAGEFHRWDEKERAQFAVCLSEAPRMALSALSTETVADLRRVFEMTTVTKKLRRVAFFSPETLLDALRWNAPSRVVYGFLNYDFPELWDSTIELDIHREARIFLGDIQRSVRRLGAEFPIQWVTTGPAAAHFLDCP